MQKVYFDGSSKGNPGPITTAVHLNGHSYFSNSGHHGSGTGNHAEYLAAMAAVDMALKNNIQSIELIGDSQIVIEALRNGSAPVGSKFHQIAQQILGKTKRFQDIKYSHVCRENNFAGTALEQHLR